MFPGEGIIRHQSRSDTHTDVHGTPYHVSEHCKINIAMALEVHSCTCPVKLTRACRSTILSLWIVEKGLYCSRVSVELRSDNLVARAGTRSVINKTWRMVL